jgi:hypothetical protein
MGNNASNSIPRPPPIASASSRNINGQRSDMNYDDEYVMSPDELCECLWRDGYCILRNAVDKQEVDDALRIINRSLGKHAPIREEVIVHVISM